MPSGGLQALGRYWQRDVKLPTWLEGPAKSEWGSRITPKLFEMPALPPGPPLPPSPPSILRQTILPSGGMGQHQGGLASLMADAPDAFPYVVNGRLEMWPVAPTSNSYRLAPSPDAALEAMRVGDAPVLWEHSDVPDPEELVQAIEDQWAAPNGGEPLFRGTPTGGGFEANANHPLFRELFGGRE